VTVNLLPQSEQTLIAPGVLSSYLPFLPTGPSGLPAILSCSWCSCSASSFFFLRAAAEGEEVEALRLTVTVVVVVVVVDVVRVEVEAMGWCCCWGSEVLAVGEEGAAQVEAVALVLVEVVAGVEGRRE
jgi:hypothetical protein